MKAMASSDHDAFYVFTFVCFINWLFYHFILHLSFERYCAYFCLIYSTLYVLNVFYGIFNSFEYEFDSGSKVGLDSTVFIHEFIFVFVIIYSSILFLSLLLLTYTNNNSYWYKNNIFCNVNNGHLADCNIICVWNGSNKPIT